MKRTVPAVAEFAAGSAFGMAYAAASVPASKLADCLAFPDKFSAIELPAEMLELKEASYLLARVLRSYKLVQTGSIIDSNVARNLPFSSESLFQEFAAYTEKLLTLFHSIGIRTATFDPYMNNILGDERALNSMQRLLRLIAPVLNRTGITLLLPFSLPCADSAQPVRLIRFLRESMIPELKVRLDINPHEIPRSLTVPSTLAGTLLLEVRSILFRYDADSGNILLADHLLPWLEAMNHYGFDGSWLAAPVSLGAGRFPVETESFSELVKQLTTKGPEQ